MFKIRAGNEYVCRDGSVVTLWSSGKYLMGNGWLFSPEEPHKNSYRVLSFKEHPHDIVAPYVEKKPRKTSSPYKKLLTAKPGDIFLLKGEKFIVTENMNISVKGIYLTSCDRHHPHGYQPIHVRNGKMGVAIFRRQDLIDLLRSGKYIIE